jgi:uncharacterized membrane protein
MSRGEGDGGYPEMSMGMMEGMGGMMLGMGLLGLLLILVVVVVAAAAIKYLFFNRHSDK